MSGILLGLALLIALLAALYVVVARPDLVAAWLYRLLRDPDSRLGRRLLVVQRPSRYEWLTEVQEAELGQYGDPYPPEAAEAPDPVDEHFKSSPRVVAGSDIDRQLAIRRVKTDAAFDALVAAQLADLDTHLSAYYVLPNPEVKQ